MDMLCAEVVQVEVGFKSATNIFNNDGIVKIFGNIFLVGTFLVWPSIRNVKMSNECGYGNKTSGELKGWQENTSKGGHHSSEKPKELKRPQ
jgi:hypothetical protein